MRYATTNMLFSALTGEVESRSDKFDTVFTEDNVLKWFQAKPRDEVVGYAGNPEHCPLAECFTALLPPSPGHGYAVMPEGKGGPEWSKHLARTVDAGRCDGDPVTAGECVDIMLAFRNSHQENTSDA